jgi:DNA-binding MurR/RpiR family transcriptional regulator
VRQSIDAAQFAEKRGARIVAVTDSEMSPLMALTTLAIMVRTETPSFFHTMAPAFAAVECLAALVAARRGPAALAALEASEQQLAAFGTYVLPPAKGRRQP